MGKAYPNQGYADHPPPPLRSGHIYIKDALGAESKEKSFQIFPIYISFSYG